MKRMDETTLWTTFILAGFASTLLGMILASIFVGLGVGALAGIGAAAGLGAWFGMVLATEIVGVSLSVAGVSVYRQFFNDDAGGAGKRGLLASSATSALSASTDITPTVTNASIPAPHTRSTHPEVGKAEGGHPAAAATRGLSASAKA